MRYCLKIFACVLILAFTAPSGVEAISLTTPFGGKVMTVIPCTCQYTSLLMPRVVTVGPPRPGIFLQTIFTRLFTYFNVAPGKSVLGLASNIKMPCMDTAGLACSARVGGPYNIMLMVGTSK